MKFITCVLLVILPCTVTLAQKFSYNQGEASTKNYYEEIPYETINGKIFVYPEIAGVKHKFLFDTGAPAAIDQDLGIKSGAKIIHTDVAVDAYGNKDSIRVMGIDLKLGSTTFTNVPAITLIPAFYKCWGVEGVIGSNLLHNSIVSINAAKHTIIITDQESKLALSEKKFLPLMLNEQSDPKVKLTFGDKTELLLGFDTGDSELLRISEDGMNRLKKAGACEVIAKGYGANSFSGAGAQKAADKYRFQIPVIIICGYRFEHIITESNKQVVPGFGTKLLNYGVVTLDYINKKFYFEGTTTTIDLYEKQWPFHPTLSGDKLVVGVVWKDSSIGFKPGEQITAVNDVDYSHINLCDLLNNKSILDGKETATLTIKDDKGVERKVQIDKR